MKKIHGAERDILCGGGVSRLVPQIEQEQDGRAQVVLPDGHCKEPDLGYLRNAVTRLMHRNLALLAEQDWVIVVRFSVPAHVTTLGELFGFLHWRHRPHGHLLLGRRLFLLVRFLVRFPTALLLLQLSLDRRGGFFLGSLDRLQAPRECLLGFLRVLFFPLCDWFLFIFLFFF